MEELKNYYATAYYFVPGPFGSLPDPTRHRYFVFLNFDSETLKLVSEENLCGNWPLKCGRRERFAFERIAVSHGPELSDLTVYHGQSYKRTPARKTFMVTREEFLEQLNERTKSKMKKQA
jgi:hypothetical protein